MELAYVGVTVTDRPAFENVLREVIGLAPGNTTTTSSAWRNDRKIHRVIVHDGDVDDVAYFALAVPPSQFVDIVSGLEQLGISVESGPSGQAKERRVDEVVNVMTPWGVRLEIVHGLGAEDEPNTPLVPGGFLTGAMGFGHVVFSTDQLDASDEFLVRVLGFTQTDWLELDTPTAQLVVRFYHCNARHHTIALAGVPKHAGARALDHIMVEANDVTDVRRAYRRACDRRFPMSRSLGQHENDRFESFYAATPSGISVELGAGGRHVHQPWNLDVKYARISLWGHEREQRSGLG